MKFKKNKQQIELSDLKAFESKSGFIFPEDYKAHMLKYNGGRPKGECVCFQEKEYDDEIELFYFHPLKGKHPSLEISLEWDKGVLPENHLTIGTTSTGNICICLEGNHAGSIYVYYSDAELEFLAPSFSGFVEDLSDID